MDLLFSEFHLIEGKFMAVVRSKPYAENVALLSHYKIEGNFYMCSIVRGHILAGGQIPKNTKIDFSNMKMSDAGVTVIAEALLSGRCPEGLQLDLSHNSITNVGVIALARALKSGRCPAVLQIDLSFSSMINDEGGIALAEALKSGNCPQDLRLCLNLNSINSKGARALIEALESGHCPSGLQLEIESNYISEHEKNQIKMLLKKNEIRHTLLSCATLAQDKRLPDVLARRISEFVIPLDEKEAVKARRHCLVNLGKIPRNYRELPSTRFFSPISEQAEVTPKLIPILQPRLISRPCVIM